MSEIECYGCEDVVRMVVGNKNDLENEGKLNNETGQELANVVYITLFEVCAKTGENVVNISTSSTKGIFETHSGCDDGIEH